MKLFEEIKISLLKPQLYYKLKGESFKKILRFLFIVSLIGFIFFNINQIIFGVVNNAFNKYIKMYKDINLSRIIITLIYMWIGSIISSIVLSSIFYIISKFKNNLKFKDVFNYTSHSLIISSFLAPFLGPFVLFLNIAYFSTAVKLEN